MNQIVRIALLLFSLLSHAVGHSQFSNVNIELGIYNVNEGSDYGNGISFFDFNRDGWDDLTIGNGAEQPLFLVNQQGVLTPASFNIPVNPVGQVIMILWADYDNDNDSDLLITQLNGPIQLWQNDGNFNFTEIASEAGLEQGNWRYRGAAFCDYDHDGYLDLYIAKYYNILSNTNPNHKSRMYHNNGDGTFTDVTEASGVDLGPRATFQPVFFDYNNDGWEDLYLVIDRNVWTNELFRNNGDGSFTKVSAITGGTPSIDAMTCSVDDFDNDGDFDFYITNGLPGNHLYLNNNGISFTNIATFAGVVMNTVSWGALWIDYDNNSWQDLFVGTTQNLFLSLQNRFYRNNQNLTFTDITLNSGLWGDVAPTYVSAMGDLNNDGYYDFVTNNNEPYPTDFWRNNGGSNNYLTVTLEGRLANRDGIGSRITCYANGNRYTRYTMCGENLHSQKSGKEIFGLGDFLTIDSLIVNWNSGTKDVYHNVSVNQHIHVIEGITTVVPPELNYTDSIVLCAGDTLLIVASNGHNYVWNTGATGNSIEINSPGAYYVTSTDVFGHQIQSALVQIIHDPLTEQTFDIMATSCYSNADGSINHSNWALIETLNINGQSTEPDIQINLPAGVYELYYTSISSCPYSSLLSVPSPAPIDVQFTITQPTEIDGGQVIIGISGGTAPYMSVIENLSTNDCCLSSEDHSYTNLAPGIYQCTITDSNNCIDVETFILLDVHVGEHLWMEQHIFPNPAGEWLRLPKGVSEVSIMNASGQCMLTDSNTTELNLKELPAGIYYASLRFESGEMQHEKLIILK